MYVFYSILTLLTLAMWLSLMIYNLPGTYRVIFGRPRRYDLLATLYAALALNRVGHTVLGVMFTDYHNVTITEAFLRIALAGFSAVCIVTMIAVIRHYRRMENPFT